MIWCMFCSSEMWSLFNISDSPSLTLYDLEKGVREDVTNIIPTFMIQATVESFATIGHSFLVCIIMLKVPPVVCVSVRICLTVCRPWVEPSTTPRSGLELSHSNIFQHKILWQGNLQKRGRWGGGVWEVGRRRIEEHRQGWFKFLSQR